MYTSAPGSLNSCFAGVSSTPSPLMSSLPEDRLYAKQTARQRKRQRMDLTSSQPSPLPPELWCKVMQSLAIFDPLWDMRESARDLANASRACKAMATAVPAGWQELAKHCPDIISLMDNQKMDTDHAHLLEVAVSSPHDEAVAGLRECCLMFCLPMSGDCCVAGSYFVRH